MLDGLEIQVINLLGSYLDDRFLGAPMMNKCGDRWCVQGIFDVTFYNTIPIDGLAYAANVTVYKEWIEN